MHRQLLVDVLLFGFLPPILFNNIALHALPVALVPGRREAFRFIEVEMFLGAFLTYLLIPHIRFKPLYPCLQRQILPPQLLLQPILPRHIFICLLL